MPGLVPDLMGFGASRGLGTQFALADHVDALTALLNPTAGRRWSSLVTPSAALSRSSLRSRCLNASRRSCWWRHRCFGTLSAHAGASDIAVGWPGTSLMDHRSPA